MAEQLGNGSIGHNSVLKGVTQAQFLRWLEEMRDIDQRVAEVVAERKDMLASIKAEIGGKDEFEAFKRARKDSEMSGEARERRELAFRKLMSWLGKPVGFQASMDLKSEDSNVVAVNVHQLKTIDHEGEEAGKGGRRRAENPYTPGTEQAQRWDSAWLRGQAAIADSMAPDGAQLRQRGRPPGSKNRPKGSDADDPEQATKSANPSAVTEAQDSETSPASVH